jgi:DNA modification methylase
MTTESDTTGLGRRYAVHNRRLVERAPVAEITLPPREVRKISKKAIAVAKAQLTELGQQQPLLISETGELVAGHEFLLAAKELAWDTLLVVRTVDLTPDQIRVLRLALHKLPELSAWDEEALRLELLDLLEIDLGFEIEDLSGFATGEIDLLIDGPSQPDRPDPADELPAADGPAVTREGDLWTLGGSHRLYCGDSREAEGYSFLMAGQKARMVFTDPPYNIPIAGHVSGLGRVKHGDFAMGCGEMSEAEFTGFLSSVLKHLAGCCVDGALVYVFMDRRHLLELQVAAKANDLSIVDLAVWNKLSGGMGSFYRSQHEPAFIFRVGKASYINNIELGRHGRYRTNVWDYPGLARFGRGRQEALAAHATVKPVALVADAIKDCTRRGDIVLDAFAGSGTTLIAAERTGRIGCGIELDCGYCDTAIRRFEALTGKSAVHVESGLTFAEMAARRQDEAAEPPCPTEPPGQFGTSDRGQRARGKAPVRLRRRPAPAGADA